MAAVETRQNGPSIDKLLDFFVANDGTAYYQVKWKPTWEKADALLPFNDLVDNFWKFINGAHTGNLYNNQSMIKGPDPVMPPNIPPETYQQPPNIPLETYQQPPNIPLETYQQPPNNVQSVQEAPPRKPISRQKSNSQNPQQKLQSIPQPQDLSKKHSLSSVSDLASPPRQQRLSAPLKNTFTEDQSPTVIIDSDEDDNLSELPNLGIASSTQNVPGNVNLTQLPAGMQQQQQQYMSPMWNMPTKIEPSEEPDQKPFQGNQQQQQFQFPMQNFNTNSNGRGNNNKARGSGRGRGGTPRIQPSPNKQPKPPAMKIETPDDMDVFVNEKPTIDATMMDFDESGAGAHDPSNSEGMSAANWKDYFETRESYVDGQKVGSAYKCKVCGSTIANLGNCKRHFKKHITDGSGEHECPVCGKKFHRIDYIERHLKQHGQGSNEEVQKMIKLISAGMKKK